MRGTKKIVYLVFISLLTLSFVVGSAQEPPITFKFFNADASPAADDQFKSPVARRIQNLTGVTLQLDYPIGEGGVDKLQLMVASGDYPDLIYAKRSEEHTSELQSRPHLVCRL